MTEAHTRSKSSLHNQFFKPRKRMREESDSDVEERSVDDGFTSC